MPTKKSRERYQLERFLPKLFGGKRFPFVQPDPPLPDAVIEVEGRKIGIEITELIPDEQISRREGAQKAILKKAQMLFEEKYHLPLYVEIEFNETVNWKAMDRDSVSVAIVKGVEQCVQSMGNLFQYKAEVDARIDLFIHTHISEIIVTYLVTKTDPCWYSADTFYLLDAPSNIIQEIIANKNRKINGYLKGCDEVWLLIIETGSQSSYFDNYERAQEVIYESDFVRTLIGRISKEELVVLRTKSTL